MNCPHDYENDDCTNCANGLPPFHCLMNDEEDKKAINYVHKKALERDAEVRTNERTKVFKWLEDECFSVRDIGEEYVSIDDLRERYEQIKEQGNE